MRLSLNVKNMFCVSCVILNSSVDLKSQLVTENPGQMTVRATLMIYH